MRRSLLLVVTLGLTLALPPTASAALSANAQEEITYLLGFVESSGCEFYRNGSWHDPSSARAHLRDKYEYLAARDRVQTAEDFIERAATKSSLTGRPYQVRCGGGTVVMSNQWLRDALAHHRACSAVSAHCASRLLRDAPSLNNVASAAQLSRPL